jgi:hypothetical protein
VARFVDQLPAPLETPFDRVEWCNYAQIIQTSFLGGLARRSYFWRFTLLDVALG